MVQVEARVQFAISNAPAGGRTGEADIVFGQKASQHRVGLIKGGGSRQAQFTAQPVLEGAPRALDPAFGLR